MNTNRTRGCVKFTTCCTNDDSRCVGFWNIYRDELFCLGGITRALWKMIRFTFWGKIVNCRLLIVVFEGYAPIFRKFYDVNSFFNPLEQRGMKRVSIKNLVKKSKISNLMYFSLWIEFFRRDLQKWNFTEFFHYRFRTFRLTSIRRELPFFCEIFWSIIQKTFIFPYVKQIYFRFDLLSICEPSNSHNSNGYRHDLSEYHVRTTSDVVERINLLSRKICELVENLSISLSLYFFLVLSFFTDRARGWLSICV